MSIGPDLTGITEGDLRFDFTLFKHLQIIGGYRWLDYRYLVAEEESSIKHQGVIQGAFCRSLYTLLNKSQQILCSQHRVQ